MDSYMVFLDRDMVDWDGLGDSDQSSPPLHFKLSMSLDPMVLRWVWGLNRWLSLIRWSTDQRWEGRSPLLWENQVEPGAIRRGLIALGQAWVTLHRARRALNSAHAVVWEMGDTHGPSIRWLEIGSTTDWPHPCNDTMYVVREFYIVNLGEFIIFSS